NFKNNPKLILAVLFSAAIIFASMYFPPLASVFSNAPLTLEELAIAFGFSAVMPLVGAIFGMITHSGKKE
ncbi:MAG: cation transporting ATPase C-terminal domain-containing protein, partial [Oscillospiraceae bacterium]